MLEIYIKNPNAHYSSIVLLLLPVTPSSRFPPSKTPPLLLSFPTKNTHPTSFSSFHLSKNLVAAAKNSVSSSEGGKLVSELLDDELLGQLSAAKDAGEVLALIAKESLKNGGVVSASDFHLILSTALDRGNAELALSVFSSMRSSFDSGARWGEMLHQLKDGGGQGQL